MDTGDIIYFVLMIGAVVVSLIKKQLDKNKPVGSPTQKVPDMMTEVFPDFKNWLDPEEEEPVLEPARVEVAKPVQPLVAEVETQKHFTYDNNTQFATDKSYFQHGKAKTEPEYILKGYFDDEELDMKRAIVYGAILNRPHF